jgi:5-methyltetrahydropteroyltriglutamate--homocysteine methyltransferase
MGSTIKTSHAGSLPRPDDLLELNRRRAAGEGIDDAAYAQELEDATVEVVRRQREVGIDLPNDGEYGHAMGQKVDYGAWWSYIFGRLGGLGLLTDMTQIPVAEPSSTIKIGTLMDRRDWKAFSDAYFEPEVGIMSSIRSGEESIQDAFKLPVCDGPLTYTGQAEVERDIANLEKAMEATGTDGAFMCSIGPASCSRIGNTHYATDEEFVFACADAMREEYLAITNAGIIVQIDEPSFAESWDQFSVEPTLEEYRKFTDVRVEALNHALRGIPPERIRFHTCYSINMGPRVHDMELRDIVDLVLEVDAGAYSFEAANPRHEHEWRVWEDAGVPEDKILIPGVVSHSTVLVEHPDTVAERILRYASVVGRERVIAGADCGFASFAITDELDRRIVWAKLEALGEGARRASEQLW